MASRIISKSNISASAVSIAENTRHCLPGEGIKARQLQRVARLGVAALSLLFSTVAVWAEPTLAEIGAVLAHKTFIDLTQTLSETSPVWEGFPEPKIAAARRPDDTPYTITHDGFRANAFAMIGQSGTHIDPPAHFSPNGATLDRLALHDMILPLVVFDATPFLKDNPAHAFSLQDLEAWERAHGQVPEGAFVALRTDMSKDFATDPARFKRNPFPGWSVETVQFLVEKRRIKAIGHESLDADVTESMETESYILKSGHYQIEVMANLDRVPATGALIVVSFAKIKDGLGFPARVFAILP